MGMYTELFFRAELKEDAPEELVEYLATVLNPDGHWSAMAPFDDHLFFQCDRWRSAFWSSSYSHPQGESKFHPSDGIRNACIVIHSSLKNYGGEIDAFVEWITPWVDHCEGDLLGYSLYEDSRFDGEREQPELIFMPKL